jgi:hypothetical protein
MYMYQDTKKKIKEYIMKKVLNFIYRLIGLESEESKLTDSYK